MQFLTPFGFFLALLAIPIILLYMLRLRRKQVQVSSTFLWIQLLREQQANAPWQKLKHNLLLILQLMFLMSLVIAFTRPAVPISTVASGSVIVLLDASASMNATDVSPSRFEAARKSIRELIDGLSSNSLMTLIVVADAPQTLVSSESDKMLLKRALDSAHVTQTSGNWVAAFALAASAARNQPDATIVVVSDGGVPKTGLPTVPIPVHYIRIGTSQNNLAISALAVRPAQNGPQLFAKVNNYSEVDRKVLLSIYSNNKLLDARQLNLKAGGSNSITLDKLSNTSSIYKAQISDVEQNGSSLDALALDNTAFAVYEATSARRVLLISHGNVFLEQLLASLPGLQPFRALPAENGALQLPQESFDLYVVDGNFANDLPNANILLINPSNNPWFKVGNSSNAVTNVRVKEDPLTRFVDWKNVHIREAKTVEAPSWANVLVESDAGPLVFAGENNGHRIAVLAFDLRQSDLPLQIAYPILLSNLVNYLAPPGAFDATRSLQPGEVLSIVQPTDVDKVVIATPSNLTYSLSSGQTTFTRTRELGFYAVNFLAHDSTRVQYFAVNLFDANESNIQPAMSIQVGTNAVTPAGAQQAGQRELWKWLAVLAIFVLIIEWQLYHRRQLPIRLPTRA